MAIDMINSSPVATHTPTGKSATSGRRRHKHLPGNEDLCQYASKACYTPRVAKNTGEMHRYCEHHRVQANRNQRRLEQRRRVKQQPMASPSSTGMDNDGLFFEPLAYTSDDASSGYSIATGCDPTTSLATYPGESFEPFRFPVALHEEDFADLLSIFNEPSLHQDALPVGHLPVRTTATSSWW